MWPRLRMGIREGSLKRDHGRWSCEVILEWDRENEWQLNNQVQLADQPGRIQLAKSTVGEALEAINWKELTDMEQRSSIEMVRFVHGMAVHCCCWATKLCPTLCNPMGCSPPGCSVHGTSQARILGWFAIFCSRGSSWSRKASNHQATREAPTVPYLG